VCVGGGSELEPWRVRPMYAKSGMRHIAPGGRIDGSHADFGGLGQERTNVAVG